MRTVFSDTTNTLVDVGGGMYRHDYDNTVIKWSRLIPQKGMVLVHRANGYPTAFSIAQGKESTGFVPLVRVVLEQDVKEFGSLFSEGAIV